MTTKENEKLKQIQDREWELDLATSRARDITKQIKYDDTPINIISEIRILAEDVGIPEEDQKYLINDVYKAQSRLESAVYSLEEMFEDVWSNVRYEIEELEEEEKATRYETKRGGV